MSRTAKLTLGLMFVALAAIVLFGCQKEISHPTENPTAPDDTGVQSTTPRVNFCNDKDIVAWGDGYTEGPLSVPYPEQLSKLLGNRTVLNMGRVGYTSTRVRQAFMSRLDLKDGNAIIWAGRSNYRYPLTVIADIKAMVSALGHDRFIVVEIPNGDYPSEWYEQPDWERLKYLNDTLAKIFTYHFVRFKSKLVNEYYANEEGDYAHDVSPAHLRTDEVHNNTEANGIIAQQIANALASCEPPVSDSATTDTTEVKVSFSKDYPIVMYGDSHTEKWVRISPTELMSLPSELDSNLHHQVINLGKSGWTSTQVKTGVFNVHPEMRNFNTIIWVGANNMTATETILSDIAEMVGKLGHDRFLVIELPPVYSIDYQVGHTRYVKLNAINDALEARYGKHFVRMAYAVKAKANPNNAQEMLDVANGLIPKKFYVNALDNVHFGSTAKYIYAKLIASRINLN